MKVTFERDYKRIFTVEEYEQAKRVIAYEKDDDSTPKGWLEMALTQLCSDRNWTADRVIEAEAKVVKNCRINQWSAYGEDTGMMDVYISGVAHVWMDNKRGYVELSAHLTDIWQYGNESQFNISHIYYTPFEIKRM